MMMETRAILTNAILLVLAMYQAGHAHWEINSAQALAFQTVKTALLLLMSNAMI